MASTDAPPTLPAKRKRAVTSYAEENDELDNLLDMDVDEPNNDDDEVENLDVNYGSRKKLHVLKKRRMTLRKAKQSLKPKKPGKPFPFLALPQELRDQVYELAFTENQGDGISLISKFKGYRRTVTRGAIVDNAGGRWTYSHHRGVSEFHPEQAEAPRRPFIPALMAANKQIYSEAVGFLYKQPFVLSDTKALHHFLAAIGSHRTRLTDLTIKGWGNGRGINKAMNFSALTMLTGCLNLKKLTFDCRIGYTSEPKFLARQLYRDGCYFFEAFGTAHGKKDAILDILEVSHSNYHDGWRHNWRMREEPVKGAFKKQFHVEMRKLLCGSSADAEVDDVPGE